MISRIAKQVYEMENASTNISGNDYEKKHSYLLRKKIEPISLGLHCKLAKAKCPGSLQLKWQASLLWQLFVRGYQKDIIERYFAWKCVFVFDCLGVDDI